eukprot:SAG11_NODE_14704_length_602_cov_1.556660_1_plen_186_part_10
MCRTPYLPAPEPEPEAEPEPQAAPTQYLPSGAERRGTSCGPYHGPQGLHNWLLGATTNTTYSFLFVPFIHGIFDTGRAIQMNIWWRDIFDQQWDDLIHQYRQRFPLRNGTLPPEIRHDGYITADDQERILDLSPGLRTQLERMIQEFQAANGAAAAVPATQMQPLGIDMDGFRHYLREQPEAYMQQ